MIKKKTIEFAKFTTALLPHNSQSLDEADAILLIFDITSADSFSYLTENYQRSSFSNKRVVLVGTKSDLSDMREVQKKDTFRVAGGFGSSYFEVSAKTGKRRTTRK
jgi:GTPase SAR1 family protein